MNLKVFEKIVYYKTVVWKTTSNWFPNEINLTNKVKDKNMLKTKLLREGKKKFFCPWGLAFYKWWSEAAQGFNVFCMGKYAKTVLGFLSNQCNL